MYFVYILRSGKNDSFYIGSTTNLQERLSRHNQGRSPYTKNKRPWQLVYYESFPSTAEARRRKREIKQRKSRFYLETLIARSQATG